MAYNKASEERNGGSGKKPRKNSCASLASARTGLRSFVPTIGRFSILTGGITNIMRMAAIISNSLQQMRRNRM